MSAVLEYADVEVLASSSGFIIGRSHLGVDRLAGPTDAPAWVPMLGDARSVTITRGGDRDATRTSLAVGTTTVTFVDAGDPMVNPSIKPNTPLRVVAKREPIADGLVVEYRWTSPTTDGWTAAADAEIAYNVAGHNAPGSIGAYWGIRPARVEIAKSPAVELAAGVTYRATGWVYPRQGFTSFALALGSEESWPVSLPAGAWGQLQVTFTPEVAGPYRLTLSQGLEGYDLAYDSGTFGLYFDDVTIERVGRSALVPVYTGWIQDVATSYDKSGRVFVTVVATDAVQALANTSRFGAVTPGGAGWEWWPARYQRLMASSPVAWLPPEGQDRASVTLDGVYFRPLGTRPSNVSVGMWTFGSSATTGEALGRSLRWSSTSGAATLAVGQAQGNYALPMSHIVGREYSITLQIKAAPAARVTSVRLSVPGTNGTITFPVTNDWQPVTITYTATNLRHELLMAVTNTIALPTTSAFAEVVTRNLRMERLDFAGAYRLGDVVYESSLLNHLDVACNSIGARWWVGADGLVRASPTIDTTPTLAHFTDAPSAPTDVSFTDVAASYETRTLLNDVTLQNHGRRLDPDTASWVADDQTYGARDATSVATWGARSGSLDTSLYGSAAMAARAGELLRANAAPELRISRLRYNALDRPDLAHALDIYSRVRATLRGHSAIYRVIGISHDMQPTRWSVTLTLAKDL